MEERKTSKMKKYSFIFWCGYVSNKDGKPSIQHVTEKEISEGYGFFDEDIKEIKDLSVGQKHDIHGILESMSVYRYN
jgi:hypothetical protein